jgi:hypothetical protein
MLLTHLSLLLKQFVCNNDSKIENLKIVNIQTSEAGLSSFVVNLIKT